MTHTKSAATSTLARFWDHAVPFQAFLAGATEKRDLWESYTARARVHDDERARVENLPAPRRLLVLVEDWCGDAIRSIPTLVALADASDDLELRVLDTDAFPGALDENLTRGARAIPIVLVGDASGDALGTWGPRPAPLQAALRRKLREEGAPTPETKGEFYAPIMGWYAKDRGRTVAQEILMLLERG